MFGRLPFDDRPLGFSLGSTVVAFHTGFSFDDMSAGCSAHVRHMYFVVPLDVRSMGISFGHQAVMEGRSVVLNLPGAPFQS